MENKEEGIVKVNLMGRIFELPPFIVKQIPFLVDAITDCVSTDVLRIHRSPLVFDHILSFLLDRMYPYPSELEYELKFYCIEYKPEELKHDRIIHKLDRLEQSTRQIMGQMTIRRYLCVKEGCSKNASPDRDRCKYHWDNCYHTDCMEITKEYNYCDKHKKPNIGCIEKYCTFSALRNTEYCLAHITSFT